MYDLCFFFFQAEDGIRDDLVTGVQTCALPISFQCEACTKLEASRLASATGTTMRRASGASLPQAAARPRAGPIIGRYRRSEERRVGKECRYRWRTEQ